MSETYYAGTYWRGRKESAEACARHAEEFFRLIAHLEPTWSRWFEKADSLEAALKLRVDPVTATFEALFARKTYQLKTGGYFLGLWNGEQHPGATSVTLACGQSSQFAPNSCILEPPTPARVPAGERIVTASIMTQVLRAMALAWEPDHGVAMSHAHREQLRTAGRLPSVLVGWVTYLSRRRGTVPSLPAPVRIEPVEDLGTLIVLTPERFSAGNPAHVELATQVHQILNTEGLLAPEQPTSTE